MKTMTVDLSTMVPKGKVRSEVTNHILKMTTTRAIHDVGYNIRRDKINSFTTIPGQYKLPMRIDMSISIDMPTMLLFVGDGHISFGSPWMENRNIEDIAMPKGKPKVFDNHIEFNEFVDISVIYNLKEMQILINGEERYYSTKERYMKSDSFRKRNKAGFDLGITCTKRADLQIRSIVITEHEDEFPLVHIKKSDITPISNEILQTQKPTFESCIEELPPEIHSEIIKTDTFLKSLQNMKFKRMIEKHGNKITYVESNRGVSYAMYLSKNLMHHSVQYYIITNGKPETWGRKDNPLEEVLKEIGKTKPELADRIFYNLNECIGCGEHCMVKTPYSYQSQKKITCHGKIFFKMCLSDFQDIRDFFSELNLLPRK